MRTDAAYSILHDHVEDSMIVAPNFCYLEKVNYAVVLRDE